MESYLEYLASSLKIPIWMLVLVLIWTAVWKLIALWKSARRRHLVWFIVIALVNTLGILEILYIFLFSKLHGYKKTTSVKPVKKIHKKSKRKRKA